MKMKITEESPIKKEHFCTPLKFGSSCKNNTDEFVYDVCHGMNTCKPSSFFNTFNNLNHFEEVSNQKKSVFKMDHLLEGEIIESDTKLKEQLTNMDDSASSIQENTELFCTPLKELKTLSTLNSVEKGKTRKRIHTPLKTNPTEKKKNQENKENEIEKENQNESEEDGEAIYLMNTPKRCKYKHNENTPTPRKGKVTNTSIPKTKLKNKKKQNQGDKENEKEKIEKLQNNNIQNEKWVLNEMNMHELPEDVKQEYVSYLCSPLKRSERLIKSKIHKMLHNKKKQEEETVGAEGGEEEEEEDDMEEDSLKKKEQTICCDFYPEQEEKCWDEYYTQSVDKGRPFTGISTETAVEVITQLLKGKVKKIKLKDKEFFSPISEYDTIMEIGHGAHPMAVQMFEQWGTVGRYVGVEFSGAAGREALRCEKLRELLIKRKVEFIKILDIKYFKDDSLNGVVVESNISDRNTQTDFIKINSFKYVFAKSTLDYITCRMDNSGNCINWEDDLQISPTVVQMFDSLSDSLQNCKKGKSSSCIIFVEPNDSSKFREHILTIFKVIYTATFKYKSSAQYLRLSKIMNQKNASGYLIEKRNDVYSSFDELRKDTMKLILKSSFTKYIDDLDWFLPNCEPVKWKSNYANDVDYLVNIQNNAV